MCQDNKRCVFFLASPFKRGANLRGWTGLQDTDNAEPNYTVNNY